MLVNTHNLDKESELAANLICSFIPTVKPETILTIHVSVVASLLVEQECCKKYGIEKKDLTTKIFEEFSASLTDEHKAEYVKTAITGFMHMAPKVHRMHSKTDPIEELLNSIRGLDKLFAVDPTNR